MPIDVKVQVDEYAKKVKDENSVTAEIDLDDLYVETSIRKDNGELNAAAKKEIERRAKAVTEPKDEDIEPKKEAKKSYIASQNILHNGKLYKAGEDISGIDAENLKSLIAIKAAAEK